jgi:hypothetical protein
MRLSSSFAHLGVGLWITILMIERVGRQLRWRTRTRLEATSWRWPVRSSRGEPSFKIEIKWLWCDQGSSLDWPPYGAVSLQLLMRDRCDVRAIGHSEMIEFITRLATSNGPLQIKLRSYCRNAVLVERRGCSARSAQLSQTGTGS